MITATRNFNALNLFAYSFLLLFLELALIKWLGSNIMFLSYFSNFILLGSFFGIGIGFLQPKSSRLYRVAPLCLAFLILFVTLFPVHIAYSGSGVESLLVIGSFQKTGLPIWITLPTIFLMVTIIMASIAHNMAYYFHQFSPLKAYRLDILGSLAGIVIFSLLAYIKPTPIVWGAVVTLIFTLLLCSQWIKNTASLTTYAQIGSLIILLISLAFESLAPGNYWSPYYKINLLQSNGETETNYIVNVNGTPHQRIESVNRRFATEPFYFFPYQYISAPERVLIIGAGTGGDTAIALAHGAKHIDAVEIDPMLYQLGHELNPDKPYFDPRVNVIVDDGRAFLQRTKQTYDLIIFALTDSITLVSGQSSLRLESYIYTKEAVTAARHLLKSNGIFSMYGYYSWDGKFWLVDRYATTIKEAFGQTPCMNTFGGGKNFAVSLTANNKANLLHCNKRWTPLTHQQVSPATDDHPFVYLKTNRIPTLYLITMTSIILLMLFIMRINRQSFADITNNFDFFLMGMAFLLLETKSVINFSLLFGNTWIVNALVFSGILFLIYLSIEVIEHVKRIAAKTIYSLLLISLIIGWYLPNEWLLSLSFIPRFIIASLGTFGPVFLANLAFSMRFKHAMNSRTAFGANMIGGTIGGLLEYISLITGYQFLILLIALFYLCAFVISRSKMQTLPIALKE